LHFSIEAVNIFYEYIRAAFTLKIVRHEMQDKKETKEERLARLEDELKQLKSTLPEHCYGREGYISIHHATPQHWQKIEDIEEEIKEIKAALKTK
jgi:archaellum component FlaC